MSTYRAGQHCSGGDDWGVVLGGDVTGGTFSTSESPAIHRPTESARWRWGSGLQPAVPQPVALMARRVGLGSVAGSNPAVTTLYSNDLRHVSGRRSSFGVPRAWN